MAAAVWAARLVSIMGMPVGAAAGAFFGAGFLGAAALAAAALAGAAGFPAVGGLFGAGVTAGLLFGFFCVVFFVVYFFSPEEVAGFAGGLASGVFRFGPRGALG